MTYTNAVSYPATSYNNVYNAGVHAAYPSILSAGLVAPYAGYPTVHSTQGYGYGVGGPYGYNENGYAPYQNDYAVSNYPLYYFIKKKLLDFFMTHSL